MPRHTSRHIIKMESLVSAPSVDTSTRSTRWFCTVNGPYAANFYSAVAIKLGLATDHSAQELLSDPFLSRLNTHSSAYEYFKNSDAAIVWELAPTTQHYHLHVIIHNRNKLSRRQVMEVLGPCDVRVMIAAPHVAHEYLLKSGNEVLYVGQREYWDKPTTPIVTRGPIDWRDILSKAQTVHSYNDFLKKYVTCDDFDENCLRGSLQRPTWIQSVIGVRSDPKKDTPFTYTVWQSSMLSIAKGPPHLSHRKIINIWSAASGTGKSTLADILRNNDLKVFVFPGNMKMHDAVYMYNYEPCIIVDLARHASIENSGVYEVLEILSDQRVCSSGKYGGKSVRWLSHVFVLSNQRLDENRLPGRIDFVEAKPLVEEHYAEISVSLNFDE